MQFGGQRTIIEFLLKTTVGFETINLICFSVFQPQSLWRHSATNVCILQLLRVFVRFLQRHWSLFKYDVALSLSTVFHGDLRSFKPLIASPIIY